MKIGDTNEVKRVVTDEITAQAGGSGALRVFGTPFLVAQMENAGLEYMARELPEGKSSVGILVSAEHTAPTPVGMEVTVRVTVTNISANGKIVLNLNGEDTDITSDMVAVNVNAKEGFSAAQEGDVCVILDTNLTDDLVREGLARELVSKVQQMRKSKDFDMMDRIHIYVCADEEVTAAIEAFKDWICAETLADSIESRDGLDTVDLNGHKTGVDVERI